MQYHLIPSEFRIKQTESGSAFSPNSPFGPNEQLPLKGRVEMRPLDHSDSAANSFLLFVSSLLSCLLFFLFRLDAGRRPFPLLCCFAPSSTSFHSLSLLPLDLAPVATSLHTTPTTLKPTSCFVMINVIAAGLLCLLSAPKLVAGLSIGAVSQDPRVDWRGDNGTSSECYRGSGSLA